MKTKSDAGRIKLYFEIKPPGNKFLIKSCTAPKKNWKLIIKKTARADLVRLRYQSQKSPHKTSEAPIYSAVNVNAGPRGTKSYFSITPCNTKNIGNKNKNSICLRIIFASLIFIYNH